MRPYFVLLLFALASLAVACGGGGGGATGPTLPSAAPSLAPMRYTSASLSMKIPAQSALSSGMRRPAYVSPNTQSVQVFAYALASPSASPSPQSFPVTTPSPCTMNADGSKTCTFNVQAPLGTDQFVVKTYSVPSPGPSDAPLAVFQSGAVNVAIGATPPALSFTLTGVVKTVDVAMQSPDPSFTSSTQIGTIGTAITSSTLSITPRDGSSSPIMTDTFASPVIVTLSPTNAGVSFALAAASQCSPASSASGASATITCAKDLGDLTFSYDGTIARDSSKNPIDHVTFSATAQSAGTTGASGATGTLALQGAILTYPLSQASVASIYGIRFVKNPDATYSYILAGAFGSQAVVGHLDPSNPTAATALTLPFVSHDLTVDHNGNVWVADNSDTQGTPHSALDCYSSLTTTPTSSIALVTPAFSPQPIQPYAVTTDVNGNVWFYGTDSGGNQWAGWVGPNVCASAPPTAPANTTIPTTFADYPFDAQPLSGGGTLMQSNENGVYAITSSGSVTTVVAPAPSPGNGGGLAVDSAGNAYAGYTMSSGTSPSISILQTGSSTFTTTLTLFNSYLPSGISTDSNSPASAFAYSDSSGLIGIGTASTLSNIALTNEGSGCYDTFFDVNNDAWAACAQYNTTTLTYNATVLHFVRTSTWTAIVPANAQVYNGAVVPVAILETGNSGPFTATVSDPQAATAGTPPPGYGHTIPLTFTASGSPSLTITVTDAHGRSQTSAMSWHLAAARRRAVNHRAP